MSRPGSPFLMDVGRHKGKSIQHVPMSYLKWMVQVRHAHANRAEAELIRRGTTTPDLDCSGHAIDRASTRCLAIWNENHNPGEGLWSWLHRAARAAYDRGLDEDGNVTYLGIRWTFESSGVWPLLKTVCPRREPT